MERLLHSKRTGYQGSTCPEDTRDIQGSFILKEKANPFTNLDWPNSTSNPKWVQFWVGRRLGGKKQDPLWPGIPWLLTFKETFCTYVSREAKNHHILTYPRMSSQLNCSGSRVIISRGFSEQPPWGNWCSLSVRHTGCLLEMSFEIGFWCRQDFRKGTMVGGLCCGLASEGWCCSCIQRLFWSLSVAQGKVKVPCKFPEEEFRTFFSLLLLLKLFPFQSESGVGAQVSFFEFLLLSLFLFVFFFFFFGRRWVARKEYLVSALRTLYRTPPPALTEPRENRESPIYSLPQCYESLWFEPEMENDLTYTFSFFPCPWSTSGYVCERVNI